MIPHEVESSSFKSQRYVYITHSDVYTNVHVECSGISEDAMFPEVELISCSSRPFQLVISDAVVLDG